MCGIVGLIDPRGINTKELSLMCDEIRHRGPDDEGFMLGSKGGELALLSGKDTINDLTSLTRIEEYNGQATVGIGHRRLSILDLSAKGHQPLQFENLVIAHNGEVYNYVEIRDELLKAGFHFTTDTDTEVILKAYLYWGFECVERFIGMWSFAIYDLEKQIVFFSRDRFGIKPFYYHYSDGFFAFASEAKALWKSANVQKQLDEKNFAEYMILGKISQSEKTLFANVFELPAGCNLVYDLESSNIQKHQYYNLHNAVAEKSSDLTAKDYQELFENSVKLHMRSDVEVGSCLSGGLDSSALVFKALGVESDIKYKTFTATFTDASIDESHYVREFVDTFPRLIPYYTSPSAQLLWEEFDKMLYHQDFPVASTSIFAQWEVMKLANSKKVKVLLDGQGADEALGGYGFFVGSQLLELAVRGNIGAFLREKNAASANRGVNPYREMLRSFSHCLPASVQLRGRKTQKSGSKFINKRYEEQIDQSIGQVSLFNNFRDQSIRAVEFGLHELLRYEDRNSMAFSIESRVPFLDHRVVEAGIALPLSEKIRNGWTKLPIRKMLDGHVPSSIVWRKDKKGFVTPQQGWKSELKPHLNDLLSSFQNKSQVFNIPQLLQATNLEHTPGAQSEYWKSISTIKWMSANGF